MPTWKDDAGGLGRSCMGVVRAKQASPAAAPWVGGFFPSFRRETPIYEPREGAEGTAGVDGASTSWR